MTERSVVISDRLNSVLKANKNRNIFIWGAGNQGRGLFRVFERLGVRVCGFIDKSTVLQGAMVSGLPVYSPEKFISDYIDFSPFVIIASFFFDREIASRCVSAGLVEGRDFISYTEIKPFDYSVDISGICNLKCISCPRADLSS
jgi:FlaA1/EpsC-like NDP-sugar epimerase